MQFEQIPPCTTVADVDFSPLFDQIADALEKHGVAIIRIDGTSPTGKEWLDWLEMLKTYLNRRLFLGLFSVESHFAYYQKGDFYKRHVDAFRGESNRVLSLVTYLNPLWSADDGGELVMYADDNDHTGIKILPKLGTMVVFLSEVFEHEVLPAKKDRYSIASWFRLNTTRTGRADPPR